MMGGSTLMTIAMIVMMVVMMGGMVAGAAWGFVGRRPHDYQFPNRKRRPGMWRL
jgi:ABC-type dipeptide/oligopeptide/nickel transport system permease subunit